MKTQTKEILLRLYCRARDTHRQVKDIHEDRVAFLCFLIEAGWGPDPVQIGSI